jgi:U5 small nuclear ribonucleoprotein component
MMKYAIGEGLQFVLVLNCIDRLVLELKLPPNDAYHKLRHTVEEVNAELETIYTALGTAQAQRAFMSPLKGNVLFASSQFMFCFTLDTYAKLYAATNGNCFDPTNLAKCLWGDVYFNEATRGFQRTPPEAEQPRTFVHFILEPLYKLFAHSVGEEKDDLAATLAEVGIYLHKRDFELDPKGLLKRVMNEFFGGPAAFVDMVVGHIPNPKEAAPIKISKIYSGDQTGSVCQDMRNLDQHGYLMVQTVKNYHRPDCVSFDLFGRVFSGTLYKGDRVKLLGDNFTLDDDEDMTIKEVANLWIYEGRYRVEVSHVPAGNWVLIGGIESSVKKNCTITTVSNDEEVEIFKPLKFPTRPVIKVACEPLNPSELPKMVDGLRKIDKAYPLAYTKVEESGEHVIMGTGELYMDCLLHDLRRLYGDLEIKVADPVVQFCETVVETSSLKCFAETPNKKNKIYMVAEPLEKGISEDIEKGNVRIDWEGPRIGDFFSKNYEWDALAARSIWAFGPEHNGPNVLCDDTLPGEVDKGMLGTCKESLTQGFQWATREGPLCDDAIRSVKFKILNAQLASDPVQRG